MTITVLMSTYNGEPFVLEQINSILAQKDVDLQLIIRDDCSTDNTKTILKKIADNNLNVSFIEGDTNIGACRSFLRLINMHWNSDYIALADQDDIWDRDKLWKAVEFLKDISEPALYHSNLRIVDSDDNYIRNAHSKPQTTRKKYSFLSEPLITGCTVVYNSKLAKILETACPDSFSMHDTWIYCVASLFGDVVYDFEPHIDYRQHENNVIGTSKKNISIKQIIIQKNKFFSNNRIRSKNAAIIYEVLCEKLNEEQKNKILEVREYRKSFRNRAMLLFDGDIIPDGLFRKIRFGFRTIMGLL